MNIEPYVDHDREDVVQLSLRAWAPVFRSIEGAMDPEVFREMIPDWRQVQQKAVEAACADEEISVFVARLDSQVAGFVALRIHAEDRMGEIHMVAVDPGFQRRGIARSLTEYALRWFEEAGMTVAMVETGGDPGHEPARRTYESSGFRLLPIARYFKKL